MKFETEQEFMEYQKHLKEQVAKHSLPSPLTIKLMEQQNVSIEVMKNEMKNLSENLKNNSQEHKEMMDKMDKFIEKADRDYARQDDFIFWRNFLVMGLFLTVALSALAVLFNNLFENK